MTFTQIIALLVACCSGSVAVFVPYDPCVAAICVILYLVSLWTLFKGMS